jgi:F-type H+-transporting ATPase subunit gamma
MPGTKEIRMKIRSVQNTRKITKAMEMVAASKMRKAQERMRHARPVWREDPQRRGAHLARQSGIPAPFLVDRDSVKRVGIIVITTDKGTVRRAEHQPPAPRPAAVQGVADAGEEIDVCAIGNKGPGLHAAPGCQHRVAGGADR